jgi:hypothetical protein
MTPVRISVAPARTHKTAACFRWPTFADLTDTSFLSKDFIAVHADGFKAG